MSGWGIAETASAKEKIKSEYADYLRGLNSTGAIEWNAYSETFDIGMELLDEMYEQGEKDAVPVVRCKDCIHRPKDNGYPPTSDDWICPCLNEDDPYYSFQPNDNFYCAKGERKTK